MENEEQDVRRPVEKKCETSEIAEHEKKKPGPVLDGKMTGLIENLGNVFDEHPENEEEKH
jgi:hypothetical protein